MTDPARPRHEGGRFRASTLRHVEERQARIFAPADRPDVQVLVEGDWRPGELRAWYPAGETAWEALVDWQPVGSTSRRPDRFPQDRVRSDETDYSRGR